MDTLIRLLGAKRKEAIGQPFGDFSATGDSVLTARSFKGKTVFVNFGLNRVSLALPNSMD